MSRRRTTAPHGPYDWAWALERLRGAYADSTLATCARCFAWFEGWCARNGRTALPPSPETVAAFVADYFEGHAARSVTTHLEAIRRVAGLLAVPDPTRTLEVQLAVRRGKRTHGLGRRPAPAIDATLRDRLRQACNQDLMGLRDRALISTGYATLCRAGELLRLRVEQLEHGPDGLPRIRILKEKQDPGGPGTYAYLCPTAFADLAAWLAAAELTEGPIFRQVFSGHVGPKAIKTSDLNLRLKATGRQAGLPPELAHRLSSHGLRLGAVHDLTAQGFSLLQIMRAGRWRNLDLVAHYAREAPVNAWAGPETDWPAAARGADSDWRLRALTGGRRGLTPSPAARPEQT